MVSGIEFELVRKHQRKQIHQHLHALYASFCACAKSAKRFGLPLEPFREALLLCICRIFPLAVAALVNLTPSCVRMSNTTHH